MHTRKTALVVTLALGVAATLSGCGSSGSEGQASEPADSPKAYVVQAVKDNGGWISEDKVWDLSVKDLCSKPEDEGVAVGGVSGGLITIANLAADNGVPESRADKAAEDAYRAIYKQHCPGKLPILDKAVKHVNE
ncbi:hypothetical protein AB0O76_40560 [Streptomyces sp. NPDC086554]|uniref:hypothetical protein n=1 Tax=Streptomyces sp. NPDC086554 TaxID=3154864 RepID=UPI003423AA7B